MDRREFLGTAAASVAAALAVPRLAAERQAVVRPKRLAAGDAVGLVAPANATFQSLELQIAKESLGIPAWSGAMIGHGMPQWTLAQGIGVDADAGTIRMLESGVA